MVVPAVNRGTPFMMGEGRSKEIGKSLLELVGKIRERLSKLEEASVSDN